MSQASIETRLVTALRAESDRLQIPDGWDAIQQRIRWRPYRRATALALAMAVLAAAGLLGVRLTGTEPDEANLIGPNPPTTDERRHEERQHTDKPQGLSSGPGTAGRARSGTTVTGGAGATAQGDAEPLAGPSRILFDSGPLSDDSIYVMDEDGSGRTKLASGQRPDWSPDGTRVAYVDSTGDCVRIPDDACNEIWVMNIDGSQQRRLGPGNYPDWSPDGRRIALERFLDRDGDDEYEPFVFIMNADGSGARSLWPGRMPNWSPDGRKLAFAGTSDSESGCTPIWIWEVDGPGTSAIDWTGCYSWYPDWSPDGKQIVFSSSRGWNTLDIGVYVANADGGNVRRLTPTWEGSEPRSALHPSWSSDGRRIVYMFDSDGSSTPRGSAGIYCREMGSGSETSGWADCRTPGPAPEEIYVMNADGSNPRHVIQGRLPDFSP